MVFLGKFKATGRLGSKAILSVGVGAGDLIPGEVPLKDCPIPLKGPDEVDPGDVPSWREAPSEWAMLLVAVGPVDFLE